MSNVELSDRTRSLARGEILASMMDGLCQSRSLRESGGRIASLILDSTDVDRVALLETHHALSRVLAIAPSGRIQQRSPQIKALESLVSKVARSATHFDFQVGGVNHDDLLPEASEYIDQSGCRRLHVEIAPSGVNPNLRAAIVVESFALANDFDSAVAISRSAVSALQLAIDREATGVVGAIHRWQTSPLGLRIGTAALILLLCLLALWLIPAELTISANGHLRPTLRQAVFAPSDGVIEGLVIQHGDRIEQGQTLLRIRNAELELQHSRLEGELATLRSQLASVVAARSQRSRGSSDRLPEDLSAQEEDLEIRIAGLAEQRAMLTDAMEDLVVVSPLGGTVDRWDLKTSLESRPVTMGQHLFDILDTNGDWELQLDVPDDVVGYLLAAQRAAPCEVQFRVRSQPNTTYASEIVNVSGSTQIDGRGRASVSATAPVNSYPSEDLRAGASVIAKIGCGQRSLGFVWFRELIEFVQRRGFLD